MVSLLLLVLTAAPKPTVVSASPERGFEPSGERVDAAEVLALSIKSGWAAVKITSQRDAGDSTESDGPFDCGYAGMKGQPRSGVRIITWSLKAEKIDKVFVIYNPALTREDCTDAATSKAALASAKAEIAARGLVLGKPLRSDFGGITFDEKTVSPDAPEDDPMGGRSTVTATAGRIP